MENEQCVLSSIMMDNSKMDKALLFLEPKDFWDSKNREIYSTMIYNYHNNIAIDYVTVYDRLKSQSGIDYLSYLMELGDLLPTAENIDSYIYMVRERNNKKILIDSVDAIKNGEMTSQEAVDVIEETIDNLKHIDNTETIELRNEITDYMNSIADGKSDEKTLKTGFSLLNQKLSIKEGNLIIIGARPAVGKTAYALNLMRHFAQQNLKVLFVSLEMTRNEIMDRLFSTMTGISAKRIADKDLNKEEKRMLFAKERELKSFNIKIFDRGNLKIENLVVLCNKLKTQGELDVLLIDYIGLLNSNIYQEHRVNQMGYISRKLKQIAMDLKIPVIALAQLNRNVVDKGTGKVRKPVLSDLRDSGSLEQDANAVLFLHQDEDTDYEEKFIEVIIAKNRAGEIGTIHTVFMTKIMKFLESEYDNETKRFTKVEELKFNKKTTE